MRVRAPWVVGLALIAWFGKPEAHAEEAAAQRIEVSAPSAKRIGLETLEVAPQDEPVTLRLTGRTGLDMERVTHVHAQFPGRILEIGPQLGAVVQGPGPDAKPTPLCAVESVDLAGAKSDYLQAKVQLKLDEEALGRTDELVKTKVLGEKFLLDAQAAVTKDQAVLDAARQKLLVFGLKDADLGGIEKQEGRQRMAYEIVSPASGVITEKNVTRGELADSTLNLFTIADTSTLWVWGDVYERDWQRVRLGQKMKVIVAAFPDQPLESSIDFISPALDATARSVRVRGAIDNPNGRLLSDMYGTLIVTVDEGHGSLVVPAEAVVHKLDASFVFVKAGNGAAQGSTVYEKRQVAVQTIDVDRVRVLKGLSPGDVVVRRGALNLFNEMQR